MEIGTGGLIKSSCSGRCVGARCLAQVSASMGEAVASESVPPGGQQGYCIDHLGHGPVYPSTRRCRARRVTTENRKAEECKIGTLLKGPEWSRRKTWIIE